MAPEEKDALLTIDLTRLEENCAEQTVLMRQWGDKLAVARRKVSMEEAKLKVVKSEMANKMRQRPDAYGLTKDTDKVIDDAVQASREWQAQNLAIIEAEYQRDLIKSMVDALNDRRTELENCVKLHGQMYFAKPDTSGQEKRRHDPTKPIGKVNRK